jgi:hypothetical protein
MGREFELGGSGAHCWRMFVHVDVVVAGLGLLF